MKFGIGIHRDRGVRDSQSRIIVELSDQVEEFLSDKFYDDMVRDYGIMLTIVYSDIGKELKPKYTEYKVVKDPFVGEPMVIDGLYDYGIRILGDEYRHFIGLSDEESKRYIARKVFESFSHLDKLPKKMKDFDRDRFRSDMKHFFESNGLL